MAGERGEGVSKQEELDAMVRATVDNLKAVMPECEGYQVVDDAGNVTFDSKSVTDATGINEELWKEWEKTYDTVFTANEYFEDVNFESLCVGWCIAKGLTLLQAQEFFAEAVHRGVF